jgi:UPF0271 protein
MKIDINCDMGESYGRFRVGSDEAIMPYISSCNIACGMHGGDPATIIKTIETAIAHNKKIGAHPSYPDLMGFGRRSMGISRSDLYAAVAFQIASLYTLVEKAGGKLHHVKVHGALYNDAAINPALAGPILDAIKYIDSGLVIFTLPDSILSKTAKERGMKVMHEAFADRRYNDDLSLQSRTIQGAVISDPVIAVKQVMGMVKRKEVITVSGEVKKIQAATICVHGDTKGAVDIAKSIHNSLTQERITIG